MCLNVPTEHVVRAPLSFAILLAITISNSFFVYFWDNYESDERCIVFGLVQIVTGIKRTLFPLLNQFLIQCYTDSWRLFLIKMLYEIKHLFYQPYSHVGQLHLIF